MLNYQWIACWFLFWRLPVGSTQRARWHGRAGGRGCGATMNLGMGDHWGRNLGPKETRKKHHMFIIFNQDCCSNKLLINSVNSVNLTIRNTGNIPDFSKETLPENCGRVELGSAWGPSNPIQSPDPIINPRWTSDWDGGLAKAMGSVVTWGRCMKIMLNIVKPITVGGLIFVWCFSDGSFFFLVMMLWEFQVCSSMSWMESQISRQHKIQKTEKAPLAPRNIFRLAGDMLHPQKLDMSSTLTIIGVGYLGLSENSVPLNPMVNDHYPY